MERGLQTSALVAFLPQLGAAGGWRTTGVREDEELAARLELPVSPEVGTVLAWPALAHQPLQVQTQSGPRASQQQTEPNIFNKINQIFSQSIILASFETFPTLNLVKKLGVSKV